MARQSGCVASLELAGVDNDRRIDIAADLAALDAALAALPNSPAVFLLWPREGEPYLSRPALLRRRLLRLLKEREHLSRLLNLRHTARRIEYQFTGSALESSLLFYELARRHFPETYLELHEVCACLLSAVGALQRVPAQPDHHPPVPPAALFSVRSVRALQPSVSNRSSWICSRCAAARRIWRLRPNTPAASTAKWECACGPASRSWARPIRATRSRA